MASCEVCIDRPRGTAHPRYPGRVYPLDYGYLKATRGGDGGGIDVWIGSLPERTLTAAVCTVDLEKRDSEVKLLLGCTPGEVARVVQFHNAGSQSDVLLPRGTIHPSEERVTQA